MKSKEQRQEAVGSRQQEHSPLPTAHCPLPTKSNRKAQFFIASAVIIIIMVYFIFFNVFRPNTTDYTGVELSDFTYLLNNIEDEYGSIVEMTLANVSRTSGINANNALDSNLTFFTNFVENLTAQRYVVAGISAERQEANSSYMNASVNLTLKGVNSQVNASFNAVRVLWIGVTQIVACTAAGTPPPPVDKLDFRAQVKQEYGEFVTGLVQGDFGGVELGGSSVTLTGFTEEADGVYLFESSKACAAGQDIDINVTDLRKIFAETTRST